MRGRRVRVAAALVALAMPFAAATPASAGVEEWPRITCLSGAIDSTDVTQTQDGSFVAIAGYLDCARPADGNTYYYGIASYRPGDSLGRASLSEYTSLSPSTKFSFGGLVGRSTLTEIGVCVVTDYEVRVACVSIQIGRGGLVSAVTPLAVDAPLVDTKVEVVGLDGKLPGTTCATCW